MEPVGLANTMISTDYAQKSPDHCFTHKSIDHAYWTFSSSIHTLFHVSRSNNAKLSRLERFVSSTDGSIEVSLDSLQKTGPKFGAKSQANTIKDDPPTQNCLVPKGVLGTTAKKCWAARLHGPHSTELRATIKQFEVQYYSNDFWEHTQIMLNLKLCTEPTRTRPNWLCMCCLCHVSVMNNQYMVIQYAE